MVRYWDPDSNYNDNTPINLKHECPWDALELVQCTPHPEIGLPHFTCILGTCTDCPDYNIHAIKQENNAGNINFHKYQNITKCTVHGKLEDNAKLCDQCGDMPPAKAKIVTRKQLTLLTTSIEMFLHCNYIPMLYKYKFHWPHVLLLGKQYTGNARMQYFKNSPNAIKTIRDYAECLKFELTQEIQSEHFGNSCSLSLEGCSVCYMKEGP